MNIISCLPILGYIHSYEYENIFENGLMKVILKILFNYKEKVRMISQLPNIRLYTKQKGITKL